MDFSNRQQEPGKKFLGMGLVLAFHLVLLYALLNGLGTKIVQIIQKPMETKIVEEVKPPPPPPDTPPPPPPKLLAPPPQKTQCLLKHSKQHHQSQQHQLAL